MKTENNNLSNALGCLAVIISALNLVVIIYVANLTLSQQKALEVFKKQLESAQISYSFMDGALNVTNSGEVEAKNVKILLNAGIDIDFTFVIPGLPPFDPEKDISLNPGRALIFKIENFAPGESFIISLRRKDNNNLLSRGDFSIQATCSNCTSSAQEK